MGQLWGNNLRLFPPFFIATFSKRSTKFDLIQSTLIVLINLKGLILLSATILLLHGSAFGGDYYGLRTWNKSWGKHSQRDFLEGKVKSVILEKLDSIYEKNPQTYTFYMHEGDVKVWVGCTFDSYSVEGNTLVNQYQYYNQGYTCNTSVFSRDSKQYLLGGYGLWINHLDLMELDTVHGSWEYIKVTNQPENYGSSHFYENSKGIYVFFGSYYNPRINLNSKYLDGFFLDWESKIWERVEFKIDGADLAFAIEESVIQSLETKDYTFLVFNSDQPNLGWNIIEKETGKIYFFDTRNSDVFLSPFMEIIDNVIFYQFPDGFERSLDLDAVFAESKQVGEIRVIEKNIFQKISIKELFYILTIVLLIVLLLCPYLFRRKPTKSINPHTEAALARITEEILVYSGKMLNAEELDKILGLDELENFDSKRPKRARMVTEINKKYKKIHKKDLIMRSKNPEDRRFVYYEIQK